jgi:hypothetical protein
LPPNPNIWREEPPGYVASAMSCAAEGQLIALQWVEMDAAWLVVPIRQT